MGINLEIGGRFLNFSANSRYRAATALICFWMTAMLASGGVPGAGATRLASWQIGRSTSLVVSRALQ